MIDCPAAAIAAGPAKPAAPIGNPNFLRREPVLTGKFYGSDAGGGLAVAWRDVTGGVKLTALRYLAQEKKWKFGDQMCGPPKEIDEQKLEMNKDELFRDRLN